jgi:hypothetical protein
MKFQIKVTYAGQTRFFEVDYDDELCRDESHQPGIDSNNYLISEDFDNCVTLEILREGDPEWQS